METKTDKTKKAEIWTFLIKKSNNGKMGLWFVLLISPSLQSCVVKPPVWRKIQENGLPENLGTYGSAKIKGEIKLLGEKDAGDYEKAYIKRTLTKGCVHMSIPHMSFSDRETIFDVMILCSFGRK